MRFAPNRLLTSVALAVVMAGGVTTVTTATASATPRVNVCGSSYTYLESFPIRSGTGTTVGDIDLYWSAQSERNCAVARPVNGLTPHWIAVEISTPSGGYASDGLSENYTQYAGPVSVYAPGCVSVFGSMGYGGPYGYGQGDANNVAC